MAIATGTAIALGIGAASAGMSFAQASKQQRLMKDAQKKADQAMQEARKKLEVNVFAAQALNKEPYERQREALLSAGAQAIEAGVESERGAAATAGRVMMAQNEAQAQQAAEMNKDLMALEQQQLAEQSRLNDIGIQLDLGEVEGAQAAAANYADMAAKSQAQGVQGITNMATTLAGSLGDLSAQDASAKEFQKLSQTTQGLGMSDIDAQKNIASLGNIGGVDLSKFAGLKPLDFKVAMASLPADTLGAINKYMNEGMYVNSNTFRPKDLALNPFNIQYPTIQNITPRIK